MELVLILVRIFLAGVFSLAGVGKLLDRKGSVKAIKEFGVPASLTGVAATLLPIVEITAAILFLFTETSWYASIIGLVLMLIFIGGMAYQMAKGNAPDCHCFGQIHSEPVSRTSILRNIAFGILALFLVLRGINGQGPAIGDSTGEVVQTLFLFVSLMLLVAILTIAKKIYEGQSQILRRIDILDALSGEKPPEERDEAGDPSDGLAIGTPFPDMALRSLSGKVVTFDHLLMRAKPLLFIFTGPDCEPCKGLFPDILKWKSELNDKFDVIIISRGKDGENKREFGDFPHDDVLLQEKREFAEKVYAKWTPTAILVNANGDVISHPITGDSAIREFIEKLRVSDLNDPFVHFTNPAIHRVIKIGSKIPAFELDDIQGNKVTNEFFNGDSILTLALSRSCEHCHDVLHALQHWETDDPPKMLILADGEPEWFASFKLATPVLVDKQRRVSITFGLSGTPSAVLVNSDGVVVSEAAIGLSNIKALIGK